LNTSRIAYIQNLIETAILYHEPRIDADQVDVSPESVEGVLRIHVGYTVRGTNSRFNFVYPYYLTGAET
jgi:phage baseplate assembly protein W